MSDTAAWSAYLDELEREARTIRSLAEAHEAAPAGPFLPPTHLGPLPEELAVRVRSVLAVITDASRRVRAELAATGDRLDDLARHDVRGPRPPATFDTRA